MVWSVTSDNRCYLPGWYEDSWGDRIRENCFRRRSAQASSIKIRASQLRKAPSLSKLGGLREAAALEFRTACSASPSLLRMRTARKWSMWRYRANRSSRVLGSSRVRILDLSLSALSAVALRSKTFIATSKRWTRLLCDYRRTLSVTRRDMGCQISGIVSDTEQGSRPSAVKPRNSEKVQPLVVRDSALLDGIAIRIDNWQLHQTAVGGVARRPEHCQDS